MLQGFAGRNPLVGIHRQHLVYEVLRFRRDCVPFRGRVLWEGHTIIRDTGLDSTLLPSSQKHTLINIIVLN